MGGKVKEGYNVDQSSIEKCTEAFVFDFFKRGLSCGGGLEGG